MFYTFFILINYFILSSWLKETTIKTFYKKLKQKDIISSIIIYSINGLK